MSLAELLPAIRALPKAEQVELLHLLVDGVAEPPQPAPMAPLSAEEQLLARHGIQLPPGYVAEVWFPQADPAGIASALRVLLEGRDGG